MDQIDAKPSEYSATVQVGLFPTQNLTFVMGPVHALWSYIEGLTGSI